ncbi:hypothetical protein C8R44DRAFT_720372 [Mycena epipterygia]|nr:hypothetical protein C8R44DRAFT_720372 [Mycena epipterygia]
MTVAVYQGEDAEETWKRELAKYSGLRHPNIVQLYGAVNSGSLYATIFHDILVPLKQFVDEHRYSVISTVYLYRFFHRELAEAEEYFKSLVGRYRWLCDECISWIRCSTGTLCVEVASDSADHCLLRSLLDHSTHPRIPLSSLGPDPEMSIMSSLTLNQFHNICYWYLSTRDYIATLDPMHLSAIVSRNGKSIQEIAHIPNVTFSDCGWTRSRLDDVQITPNHMENGWSRIHSSSVDGVIRQTIWCGTDHSRWLSQANYVFSQLPTPPKHEECFFIYLICYQLSFSDPSENLLEGYLFLCPLEHLRDDTGRWLSNPECPAYWSLDPSGGQRLSPEEASRLGFPALEFKVYVYGCFWNESVYAALSGFHAAKGFDPTSQNLARHRGQPLYEISCSPGIDSVHGESQRYISDPTLTWFK